MTIFSANDTHMALLCCALLVLVLPACGQEKVAKQPQPSCTVYLKQAKVAANEETAIVLEIQNATDAPCSIHSLADYERKRILPPGEREAPVLEHREEAKPDGQLQPVVIVHVPQEAPLAQIGLVGPQSDQPITVNKGDSAFLKIRIPAGSFHPGTCKIEVLLKDGPNTITASEPVEITCIAKK